MEKLLELLKDGKSRSFEMLAAELGVSVDTVKRDVEFLEKIGMLKKIPLDASGSQCSSCSGCSGGTCPGCMPEGGFQNMGSMWEVTE